MKNVKIITLRGYQEEQLHFLEDNMGLIALESPTGTGKSFVILEYIKRNMDNYSNIIFSTGFNELVFQFAKDAKLFDLYPQVLVGNARLLPNCKSIDIPKHETTHINPWEISEDYKENFLTSDNSFLYSKTLVPNICNSCKKKYKPDNCSKRCVSNFLKSYVKKFIVTNHSYLLTVGSKIISSDTLLIIDEAHTFNNFYSSYMQISFTKEDRDMLNEYFGLSKSMSCCLFKNLIKNKKPVPRQVIDKVIEEMDTFELFGEKEDMEREIKKLTLAEKIEGIMLTNSNNSSFDTFMTEDENFKNQKKRVKFYTDYEIGNPKKTIITTATLDDYTKKMFHCTNNNQIYIQRLPEDRFEGSRFISVYDDFRSSFEEIFKTYFKDKSGLILSTTNSDVNFAKELINEKFPEVNVFTDISRFKECKDRKKVIIGSRKFFQGVNIPELEYVIMNSLPFDRYDDFFRAYSYYIEKTLGVDPWVNYTLPLVKNSILQATGRLWRKNDIENEEFDNGDICIFDKRLESKMKYFEKWFCGLKSGIELIQINPNKEGCNEEDVEEIAS